MQFSRDKTIEWIGAITAVAGTFLLALNNDYSKYGFIFYAISNFCLLPIVWKQKNWGMVFMYIVYIIMGLIGIFNFWIR
jgi:nicotinamide riboside transporter PnuC